MTTRAHRAAEEEDVAREYAKAIKSTPMTEYAFWHRLNASIIDRWSVSALRRIKKRAWHMLAEGLV